MLSPKGGFRLVPISIMFKDIAKYHIIISFYWVMEGVEEAEGDF